jgi:hypothetical protein
VFGVYSTVPAAVHPPSPVGPAEERPVVASHEGDATVCAYSVVHDRDGDPASALLVCDLPGSARTYARLTDPDDCVRAESEELVGARVRLEPRSVAGPVGDVDVNYATW